MAWGYWSATTVSDRGRSPRRNQQNNTTNNVIQTMPVQIEDRPSHPSVSQQYSGGGGGGGSGGGGGGGSIMSQVTINSNNNSQTLTMSSSEFEDMPISQLSRRPSLDLGTIIGQGGGGGGGGGGGMGVVGGPQSALAGILCAAHGSRQQGGTLSAGNTLTRIGSRHTAVEYAVPHHFHHHHHAYIEYHQAQLSFSDDDSSSEPGYATGRCMHRRAGPPTLQAFPICFACFVKSMYFFFFSFYCVHNQ